MNCTHHSIFRNLWGNTIIPRLARNEHTCICPLTLLPPPQVSLYNDTLFLYGGYSVAVREDGGEKATTHDDMWALDLGTYEVGNFAGTEGMSSGVCVATQGDTWCVLGERRREGIACFQGLSAEQQWQQSPRSAINRFLSCLMAFSSFCCQHLSSLFSSST